MGSTPHTCISRSRTRAQHSSPCAQASTGPFWSIAVVLRCWAKSRNDGVLCVSLRTLLRRWMLLARRPDRFPGRARQSINVGRYEWFSPNQRRSPMCVLEALRTTCCSRGVMNFFVVRGANFAASMAISRPWARGTGSCGSLPKVPGRDWRDFGLPAFPAPLG